MIYNLVKYLQTQILSLDFTCNGWKKDSPDSCVCVNDTGGTPAHSHDRTDHSVQVLARDRDSVKAKAAADSVYNKLKNVFGGLVLPAVSIAGVNYPAVTAWQIIPIQAPSWIGEDKEGRVLYSFNLTITTY